MFAEYGIANARPDAYEVDYLITPQLGGATSIRNLWPQPYYNTTWHARVKDQLEERLHAMVCSGEIDLATAQHDLATNWIAAYKKYFHTDKPLLGRSEIRRQPDRIPQEMAFDREAGGPARRDPIGYWYPTAGVLVLVVRGPGVGAGAALAHRGA